MNPKLVRRLAIALVALVLTPETVWRTGPVRYRMQRIAVPREARATFAAAAIGTAVVFTVLGMFSALVPSFLAGSLHEPSHAVRHQRKRVIGSLQRVVANTSAVGTDRAAWTTAV